MPKIFTTLDKIKPAYDITYKVVLFICKLLIADIVITTMSVIGRYVPFADPAWSEEVVLTCARLYGRSEARLTHPHRCAHPYDRV